MLTQLRCVCVGGFSYRCVCAPLCACECARMCNGALQDTPIRTHTNHTHTSRHSSTGPPARRPCVPSAPRSSRTPRMCSTGLEEGVCVRVRVRLYACVFVYVRAWFVRMCGCVGARMILCVRANMRMCARDCTDRLNAQKVKTKKRTVWRQRKRHHVPSLKHRTQKKEENRSTTYIWSGQRSLWPAMCRWG